MHRHALFLILFAIVSSAGAARADYVTNVGGGHGPFAASGATPTFGYADLYDNAGNNQRWLGSFSGGYQHPAYAAQPTITVDWIVVSSANTTVTACSHVSDGSGPTACNNQTPAPITVHAGETAEFGCPSPGVGACRATWSPVTVLISYVQTCPTITGYSHVQQGTGDNVYVDGSLYAAVRVTDNFGDVMHAPNADTLWVSCLVNLTAAGLASQFTAPPGYQWGTTAVAIYAPFP